MRIQLINEDYSERLEWVYRIWKGLQDPSEEIYTQCKKTPVTIAKMTKGSGWSTLESKGGTSSINDYLSVF